MAGEVCPKCGVAVTPGYVRCPNRKCRAVLPQRAKTASTPGGTAMNSGGAPVVPIAIGAGAIVLVAVAYFVFRGGSTSAAPPPPPPSAPTSTVPQAENPTTLRQAPPPTTTQTTVPRGPTPEAVASDLERELKHQHLWSTVRAVGDHMEIRSSSCREPGMASSISAAAAAAKSAGLVRLRCLEESGTVVIDSAL